MIPVSSIICMVIAIVLNWGCAILCLVKIQRSVNKEKVEGGKYNVCN